MPFRVFRNRSAQIHSPPESGRGRPRRKRRQGLDRGIVLAVSHRRRPTAPGPQASTSAKVALGQTAKSDARRKGEPFSCLANREVGCPAKGKSFEHTYVWQTAKSDAGLALGQTAKSDARHEEKTSRTQANREVGYPGRRETLRTALQTAKSDARRKGNKSFERRETLLTPGKPRSRMPGDGGKPSKYAQQTAKSDAREKGRAEGCPLQGGVPEPLPRQIRKRSSGGRPLGRSCPAPEAKENSDRRVIKNAATCDKASKMQESPKLAYAFECQAGLRLRARVSPGRGSKFRRRSPRLPLLFSGGRRKGENRGESSNGAPASVFQTDAIFATRQRVGGRRRFLRNGGDSSPLHRNDLVPAKLPPELKHITKGWKRNQRRFRQ